MLSSLTFQLSPHHSLLLQGTPGMIYSPAVDLWSAGVVLFILLGGYPPFFDESEPALFNLIRKGTFQYDDPVWDNVSGQCAPCWLGCSLRGCVRNETSLQQLPGGGCRAASQSHASLPAECAQRSVWLSGSHPVQSSNEAARGWQGKGPDQQAADGGRQQASDSHTGPAASLDHRQPPSPRRPGQDARKHAQAHAAALPGALPATLPVQSC